MKLYLYNTLTRQKEEFVAINKNLIKMYTCGPTVYNYAHIGNLRSYIFMDLLRRVLKYNGYKILGMLNITDVGHLLSDADEGEDKIVLASKNLNKTPKEIAEFYTKCFFDDLKELNIEKPEIIAKATDNVQDMLNYCEKLYEKGYAYETKDGIYFDVSKFKNYGKLSGINLEAQKAGARVSINNEKKHHYDFALWKKAPKEHIMQWDSPWGMSYPGWHIECSAMIKKFLGDVIDIHTGGVDHIPIHHENEIAQSEAYFGKKTVNYWLHGEFMLVDKGKMSKSQNNFYTLKDLKNKGFSSLDFRYFCLNAHYRKQLNFTFDALAGAKSAYTRMLEILSQHKKGTNRIDKKIINTYKKGFHLAINDDINIPKAVGIIWNALKEHYSLDIYNLILEFDNILGLNLNNIDVDNSIPEEIKILAEKRKEAKINKDYKESDYLRDEIKKKGYKIEDLINNEYKIKKL